MNHEESQLLLHIATGDADPAELDALARQLLVEIRDLEVTAVPATAEYVPDGAKGLEAIDVGALAVTLLPSMAPKLIELVQGWLTRRQGQMVKIKYTVKDRSVEVEHPHTMSPDRLQGLVETVTLALQKVEAESAPA